MRSLGILILSSLTLEIELDTPTKAREMPMRINTRLAGLAEGTNWVTLWVTNSAGLSSETNMAVVKNDITLALTSIDGDLWQATVNVSVKGSVLLDKN